MMCASTRPVQAADEQKVSGKIAFPAEVPQEMAKLLGWYGASDMLALPTRQSVRLAHAGDGFSYRKEEGVYGSGRVA